MANSVSYIIELVDKFSRKGKRIADSMRGIGEAAKGVRHGMKKTEMASKRTFEAISKGSRRARQDVKSLNGELRKSVPPGGKGGGFSSSPMANTGAFGAAGTYMFSMPATRAANQAINIAGMYKSKPSYTNIFSGQKYWTAWKRLRKK